MDKRKSFLQSFLGALGAKEILWGNIQVDKIYGTVIYDISYPDERQDFVWHMTEENVPADNVKKLLDHLSKNRLIDIDKIFTPIEEIQIDFIEKNKLESVWEKLFDTEVTMIDYGKESDRFYIHT